MIRTATQLKAKVRNLSGSDSTKAQTLIRNYIMERFLERIALSKYRNNFILKGGILVSAVVGLDTRSTMDIDSTVKSLELSKENAIKIVNEIIAVDIPDGVCFTITRVTDIMEEHDYPGIRFTLEATLDNLRQIIKVDMVFSAEMHFRAASMRKESRGWFLREDFPRMDNENWLKWIVVENDNGEMKLSTEDVPIDDYPVKPPPMFF